MDLSSNLIIGSNESFESQLSQYMDMRSAFDHIFSVIFNSSDPDEISNYLKIGFGILKRRKDYDNFPMDFFDNNAIELIVNLAFSGHDSKVSYDALSFILYVFFANKDFSINALKTYKDDIVDMLSTYINNATLNEVKLIIQMIGELAGRDEDSRDHVLLFFPFERVFEIFQTFPSELYENFATYLISITKYNIGETLFNQVKEFVFNVIQHHINEDIISKLLTVFIQISKFFKKDDIIIDIKELSALMYKEHFLKVEKNSTKAKIYTLLKIVNRRQPSFSIFPEFSFKSLMKEFQENYEKIQTLSNAAKWRIVTVIEILIIDVQSDIGDNVINVIMKEEFLKPLKHLLGNGSIEIRFHLLELFYFMTKYGRDNVYKTIIHNRYIPIITDFLESDSPDEQYYILSFLLLLLNKAQKEGITAIILDEIDNYRDSVKDMINSDDKEISNLAKTIDSFFYDDDEME